MFQRMFDLLVFIEDGAYYPTTAGNVALFIVIALLFVGMAAFSGGVKRVKTKQLVFSAMALTLAVVTSIFHLPSLPNGGSITLFRMFFICLIGYMYGTRAGVLTGIAYGFLDLILGPYVIHPIQLLLDYPIAFGSLGLAGVFSKSKYGIIKGYLLGVAGRYICHVLSGAIYFSEYAGEQNPWIYSLGYNASYIVPEAVAAIAILCIPAVQKALLEIKRSAVEQANN